MSVSRYGGWNLLSLLNGCLDPSNGSVFEVGDCLFRGITFGEAARELQNLCCVCPVFCGCKEPGVRPS